MSQRNSNDLNEALKRKEAAEREHGAENANNFDGEIALDDTQRVKVLSPGRLVAKRFFRNKLAIVGLVVLAIMFFFSFVCPLFYPYSQTQSFYKYAKLNVDYASAVERTENTTYAVDPSIELHYSVKNRLNSYISEMEAGELETMSVRSDEGNVCVIDKVGDRVYTVSESADIDVARLVTASDIATYSAIGSTFAWSGEALDSEFQQAVADAVKNNESEITYGGDTYTITKTDGKMRYIVARSSNGVVHLTDDLDSGFDSAALAASGSSSFTYGGTTYHLRDDGDAKVISTRSDSVVAAVASTYVFNMYDNSQSLSDEFKANALIALYDDGEFTHDGKTYTIATEGDDIVIRDAAGNGIAELSTYSVRRYSGQDTIDLDCKEKIVDEIESMKAAGKSTTEFVYKLPAMDTDGNYVYDEDGNLTYEDTELSITTKAGQYVINCEQTTYLIDIYASPSSEHWFGTDGDGFDILARAMYGGRISLMVGFVVVLLEMFIGIIMGGLAGFFGGWVDTLIMRLVDIFYCIPSTPILIITGSLFDQLKLDAYTRLIYMMAILGVLGWAGVARLVRGQILSLREQEFMIAEEATGIRASRRIFRHLVPNVMPQLIVSATMGLGSVIITESTLSFLGLGVKHPLATWGNMINSVTGSSEDMIRYAYIWVPVGMLICLTVIAFNFVGDGLRDAFDPKAKQ